MQRQQPNPTRHQERRILNFAFSYDYYSADLITRCHPIHNSSFFFFSYLDREIRKQNTKVNAEHNRFMTRLYTSLSEGCYLFRYFLYQFFSLQEEKAKITTLRHITLK